MKNFITILLLFVSISASADVVTGRVVDSQTKEPLEGASLSIVSYIGNTQMQRGTTIEYGKKVKSSPKYQTERGESTIPEGQY